LVAGLAEAVGRASDAVGKIANITSRNSIGINSVVVTS
jgi:hypothetical protein